MVSTGFVKLLYRLPCVLNHQAWDIRQFPKDLFNWSIVHMLRNAVLVIVIVLSDPHLQAGLRADRAGGKPVQITRAHRSKSRPANAQQYQSHTINLYPVCLCWAVRATLSSCAANIHRPCQFWRAICKC